MVDTYIDDFFLLFLFSSILILCTEALFLVWFSLIWELHRFCIYFICMLEISLVLGEKTFLCGCNKFRKSLKFMRENYYMTTKHVLYWFAKRKCKLDFQHHGMEKAKMQNSKNFFLFQQIVKIFNWIEYLI